MMMSSFKVIHKYGVPDSEKIVMHMQVNLNWFPAGIPVAILMMILWKSSRFVDAKDEKVNKYKNLRWSRG